MTPLRNEIIQRAAEIVAANAMTFQLPKAGNSLQRFEDVGAVGPLKFESLVSTEFQHLDGNGVIVPFGAEYAYTFDPRTGLVYAKTLDKQLDAEDSDAAAAAANAKPCGVDWMFAADAKWRQPTRTEALSIVDITTHDPAVNKAAFPDTKSGYYRTSSAVSYDSDYRWCVYFNLGGSGVIHNGSYAWVRLVRGPVAALPRQSSDL